jgi:hypothetical protein
MDIESIDRLDEQNRLNDLYEYLEENSNIGLDMELDLNELNDDENQNNNGDNNDDNYRSDNNDDDNYENNSATNEVNCDNFDEMKTLSLLRK